MPVFLVEHPQGNVLFDTGPHPDAFQDAASRWGEIARWFRPQGDETSGVLGQLGTVGDQRGLSPRSRDGVANSRRRAGNQSLNPGLISCSMELGCHRDAACSFGAFLQHDARLIWPGPEADGAQWSSRDKCPCEPNAGAIVAAVCAKPGLD
jgi:hypothetical protein